MLQEAMEARAQYSTFYKLAADDDLDAGNIVTASLKYRRAIAFGPTLESARSARQALLDLERHAKEQLARAKALIESDEFAEASNLIAELRRDYSALPIAARIDQAQRRLLRCQNGSNRVQEPALSASEPSIEADSDQFKDSCDSVSTPDRPRKTSLSVHRLVEAAHPRAFAAN
jgi:hypothetical protein